MRDKSLLGKYGKVYYNTARSYLETAVYLMKNNGENSAVLLYAIKTLGNNKMSNNAKEYFVKTVY